MVLQVSSPSFYSTEITSTSTTTITTSTIATVITTCITINTTVTVIAAAANPFAWEYGACRKCTEPVRWWINIGLVLG